MNAKKSKLKRNKRKKCKEEKPSDNSNVFILPPNILEQLGIDLGSRTISNEIIPTASCYTGEKPKIYTTKEKTNQKGNHENSHQVTTSLSETAKLMKNSVLLSPTFTNNLSDCNDLENTKNNQSKTDVQLIEASLLCSTSEVIISPTINLTYIHGNMPIDRPEEINPQSPEKENSMKTTQDIGLNLNDIPIVVNDSNCNFVSPKTSNMTEDFVFETPYSGLVSNINVVEAETPFDLEKCIHVAPGHESTIKTNKTVLSYIEDEVRCQETGNGIEPYANSISSQQEIEIEKSKDFEAIGSSNFSSFNEADTLNENCLDVYNKVEIGISGLDKHDCNTVDSNAAETSNGLRQQISNQEITSFIELQAETATALDNRNMATTEDGITDKDKSSPVTDNKVKEIASYLNECIKKTSSHSNRNNTATKLSTHGVEKPGGQLQLNKSGSKTYGKSKVKIKKKNLNAISSEKLLAKEPTVNEIDYSLIPAVPIEQAFCICYDFGLHSYPSLEEHVHFCSKPTLHIEKEILFEMYNDVSNFTTEIVDETLMQFVSGDEKVDPICWSTIGIYTKPKKPDDCSHILKATGLQLVPSPNPVLENNINLNYPKQSKNVLNDEIHRLGTKNDHKDIVYNRSSSQKKSEGDQTEIKQTWEHDNATQIEGKEVSDANKADNTNIKKVVVSKNDKHRATNKSKPRRTTEISPESQPFANNESRVKRRCENLHIKDCSNKEKRQKTSKNTNTLENENKVEMCLKKRKRSIDDIKITSPKKAFKCGVCNQTVSRKEWEIHAELKHCYIAWHVGEEFDFEDQDLRSKLDNIIENKNILECSFCNLEFKQTKDFIIHVKLCRNAKKGPENSNKEHLHQTENKKSNHTDSQKQLQDSIIFSSAEKAELINTPIDNDGTNEVDVIECGVCSKQVPTTEWCSHIASKHQYLAWKKGQIAIDLNSKVEVHQHLERVSKEINGLVCMKCQLVRKTAKSYLKHLQSCIENFSLKHHEVDAACKIEPQQSDPKTSEGKLEPVPQFECREFPDVNTSDILMSPENSDIMQDVENQSLCDLKRIKQFNGSKVKCGVCSKETDISDWVEHICREHKYIAWKEGEEPVKCCDEIEMRAHLQNVLKEIGELVCYKCGLVRKQARTYIKHIKLCDENIVLDFSTLSDMSTIGNDSQVSSYKCGVCSAEVVEDDWIDHVYKEHDYIAWMEGENAIDVQNEEQIRNHLHRISKQTGGLKCSKCGIIRKYAKQFMNHIKTCTGETPLDASVISNTSKSDNDTTISVKASVTHTNAIYKCGVCSKEIGSKDWVDHVSKEHQYIAWKDGDKPLDTNNKENIYDYLYGVSKELGGLTCGKCGIVRKYVKAYLSHIKCCTGNEVEGDSDSSDSDDDILPDDVRCGVCKEEMKRENWISHIEAEHNYLAWWDIEEPLDLNNEEEVFQHLKQISISNEGLKCVKCDLVFAKFPKRYLEHVKNCLLPKSYKPKTQSKYQVPREGVMECARCHAKVKAKDWSDHAMNEHYNITWAVGDTPINLKNQNSVDRFLKLYLKKKGAYKCKNCDLKRVSSYGFYAHIIVCGKSEEETEIYKELCNICNMKYLCVYKSQHMTAHKERMLMKQRRQELEEKRQNMTTAEAEIVSGKRKAAQKAISVIGNISKDNDGKSGDFSDSDVSVKLDSYSESESESDVDSDVSMKEHEQRAVLAQDEKSLRTPNDSTIEYTKTLPFEIASKSKFLANSGKDFREMYCTNEVLFPQWRCRDHEVLDKQNVSKYLPSLEESCLVDFGEGSLSAKRFEVNNAPIQGLVYFFAGATIRTVCWVPVGLVDNCDNYLTVVCHSDGDVPRHNDDELVSGPGSLQLWNCFNFMKLPFLSMVIVHDYGTIWSVSWCPSGARDKLEDNLENQDKSKLRLGLMAVACSNGYAYIFSIPHPSSKDETEFCALKPVAELRMSSNPDRRLYQATAISWCRNKGHNVILVGYADGSIGYYDISNKSPLLTCKESGVDVFYPYYETKAHSSCITGVDSFPLGARVALVCSGSPRGQALAGRGARARNSHAADHALMSRHWPAAYAAGDSGILNPCTPHDLELWGSGRRLGVARALAECAACGLLAAFTSSQLRLMRPYPALGDIAKTSIIAIDLKNLAKKSKIKSDEFGVVVEPLIYEDAIKKYGISVKRFKTRSEVPAQPKPQEVCIERFPLNDVRSMNFCSSPGYHIKLAIGLHAGFVFILDTV